MDKGVSPVNQQPKRYLDSELVEAYKNWPSDWKEKFATKYNEQFGFNSNSRFKKVFAHTLEPTPDEFYWLKEMIEKWERHRSGEDIEPEISVAK